MARLGIVMAVVLVLALAGWLVLPSIATAPNSSTNSNSAGSASPMSHAVKRFPDEWYFYGARRPVGLRELEGQSAHELQVRDWIGEEQKLSDLKGKVVVLDFWGTWCGPCMATLPHNVDLVNKYRGQDLVFIGIHDSRRGYEKMPAVARDKKINYPLAIDSGGQMVSKYRVAFWPTYVAIDRNGIIRAAGVEPMRVDDVVAALLAEQ